jgi:hypothetical protein
MRKVEAKVKRKLTMGQSIVGPDALLTSRHPDSCVHATLKRGSDFSTWVCAEPKCRLVFSGTALARVEDGLQLPALERERDDAFGQAARAAHQVALVTTGAPRQGMTERDRRRFMSGHHAGFAAGWNAAVASRASRPQPTTPEQVEALAGELARPFDPKRAVRA